MDGNEPPGKRIIQVQPSNVNKIEGIIPLTPGKNDNAINQQLILNNNKTNVKFFPFKPTPSNDRTAKIDQSFREVEIKFSNHGQDGFVAREAKFNDSIAALAEEKEENVESQQEKGKKKKGRKTRVIQYDDTKEKHNEGGQVDGKAGSDSKVNVVTDGKGKKMATEPKEKLDVDGHVDLYGKTVSDSKVKGGTSGKGIKKETKRKDKHGVDGQAGSDSKVNDGTSRKRKKKEIKTKEKHDVDGHVDGKAGSGSKVNDGTSRKREETKTKEKKKSNKSKTKVKEEAIKEELADAEEKIEEAATGNANNRRKLPCVFGFIATWLAKRKEKRRDKKRKAIAARASPPQRLVEYEHKTTRGGEAFTIEVDSRPSFTKQLLPPIKQTPGPIRRDRYQNAVCRRAENLAQRKDAAREFEKKKVKCKDKRAENDYQFRQNAHVSIKQKQANAEWNRNIMSRCKGRLRGPSAMPPSEHSDKSSNEPSAESSFWSIHGPSCFSEEEDDRGVWIVDKVVDIPIF